MVKAVDENPATSERVSRDLVRLVSLLICAAGSGLLFRFLDLPAPYLLGSMFGVWMLAAAFKPARRYLQTPRWFHKLVVLGLGVLIGAMFGPDTIGQFLHWGLTVSGMLLSTVLATLAGYLFLTRLRGYEPTLALFCSIPGGQAEVIALSRDLVEKDYVVALCHLVRVVFVFCSVPLVLALVKGADAVSESNRALSELPSLFELPIVVLLQFCAIAAGGFLLARLLRIPVAHLIGPLFVSMTLHITGTVEMPRINELVLLAQVTIGGTVGARLGQVEFRVLAGYLRDALVNVVLVLIVFVAAAYFFASVLDYAFFDVMLAFVPGGLYEITMLSLIFGFDVAFVVTHHASRMLFILFSLPLLLKALRGMDKTGGR